MKFKTKTYGECVEFLGKVATCNPDVGSEIALMAYIYGQDFLKVAKDVESFANRWQKLIEKSEENA